MIGQLVLCNLSLYMPQLGVIIVTLYASKPSEYCRSLQQGFYLSTRLGKSIMFFSPVRREVIGVSTCAKTVFQLSSAKRRQFE